MLKGKEPFVLLAIEVNHSVVWEMVLRKVADITPSALCLSQVLIDTSFGYTGLVMLMLVTAILKKEVPLIPAAF